MSNQKCFDITSIKEETHVNNGIFFIKLRKDLTFQFMMRIIICLVYMIIINCRDIKWR